jgi:hypothetical protein
MLRSFGFTFSSFGVTLANHRAGQVRQCVLTDKPLNFPTDAEKLAGRGMSSSRCFSQDLLCLSPPQIRRSLFVSKKKKTLFQPVFLTPLL